MNKIIRLVMELIFIFILPFAFMCLTLKTEVVNTYDQNNNIISSEKVLDIKELDFINTEEKTYYNYEYYDTDYSVFVGQNDTILLNFNKSPLVHMKVNTDYDVIYFNYNNSIRACVFNHSTNEFLGTNYEPNIQVINYDENVVLLKTTDVNFKIYNDFDNIIKSIETKTIQENAISKVLNIMFDTLGIENNIIIQLVVIYTILWIIMFLVWHLLYRFIDFMVHLFDRKE